MWKPINYLKIFFLLLVALVGSPAVAQDLKLNDLVREAMARHPDILASQERLKAAEARIPQASSLPDPMLMTGYQNEGFQSFTYGEELGAQWMFSASQTFPLGGKLNLKGNLAESDLDNLKALHEALVYKTVAGVKELFFDLFLTHRKIDLAEENEDLSIKIEKIAADLYATGITSQGEVLMAQMEKYKAIEQKQLLSQKKQSIEAMLKAAAGLTSNFPLDRPAEPVPQDFHLGLDESLRQALERSPELKSRERMVEAAEIRLQMAEKEYYPDVAIASSVFPRGGPYKDMWNLTASFNVPLYYKTKQSMAVQETQAALMQARSELDGLKLMVSSAVGDNHAVMRSAEKLMTLYINGLIPKIRQDFELALSRYASGDGYAGAVIAKLKSFLDYRAQYWEQFAEREKAIARLQSIIGKPDLEPGGKE